MDRTGALCAGAAAGAGGAAAAATANSGLEAPSGGCVASEGVPRCACGGESAAPSAGAAASRTGWNGCVHQKHPAMFGSTEQH